MATAVMMPNYEDKRRARFVRDTLLGSEPTARATFLKRVVRIGIPGYVIGLLLLALNQTLNTNGASYAVWLGTFSFAGALLLFALTNYLVCSPLVMSHADADVRYRYRALLSLACVSSGFGIFGLTRLLENGFVVGSIPSLMSLLTFFLVVAALAFRRTNLAGVFYTVFLASLMLYSMLLGNLTISSGAAPAAGVVVSWEFGASAVTGLFGVAIIAMLLIERTSVSVPIMALNTVVFSVLYTRTLQAAGVPSASITGSLVVTVVYVVAIVMLGLYFNYEIRRNRDNLENLVRTLELRVTGRTREIEQSAKLASELAHLQDPTAVYQAIVDGTQDTLKQYHVGLYLMDEDSGRLRYTAGSSSEATTSMLNTVREFGLDDTGLVPTAARTQAQVIVNDVTADNRFVRNPMLPLTASEAAVPLIAQNSLIGVLDLQSTQPRAFGDDSARVMQLLAGNIAVVIQNAQQYAQQVAIAEHLRQVDSMKSQFLASMSHELRTPLNAILNFTEFVLRGVLGPVNDRQVDALQKSLESGRHLLSLINDVLDIAKIEAGKMQLFIEDNVDPQEELKQVKSVAETLIADKPVRLVTDFDDNMPLMVGDRRRIRQILMNLVSNAAKFTNEGSITISAKHFDDEMLFAVIDTGPGISPEDQARIFEPFEQTEAGGRHYAGTGLGLPISRRLAEAHGGSLELNSEIGEGSAFFVHLPVRPPQLVAQLAALGEAKHG